MVVGILTAGIFYGWAVPKFGYNEGFMFTGILTLPDLVREPLKLTGEQGTVGGWVALGIVSLWSGFIASASEVVDVFGWDDNVTIPVLSGLGLWGFFKVFC
jgi:diacylglycerol kinase (CTP)